MFPRGLALPVGQLVAVVSAQPLLLLWRWLLLFCQAESPVTAAVTPSSSPAALPCVEYIPSSL